MGALKPGQGSLDLSAYLRGTAGLHEGGAALEYRHRISEQVSAFARGELGAQWGALPARLQYGLHAGLGGRF